VGEDGGHPRGAETGGDGAEAGAGGAVLCGIGEVAAVAQQDADGVQQEGDARGHALPAAIRWRIGGSGSAGCGGRSVLHGSANNIVWLVLSMGNIGWPVRKGRLTVVSPPSRRDAA
jgi:hypothetical protein